MKIVNLLVAWSVLPLAGVAADMHVEKTVRITEANERYVAKAYDAYLLVIAKRPIPKDFINFPVALLLERPEYFILERAYYITPNELRGFSLAIPKPLMKKIDDRVQATKDLELDKESVHQGIHAIVLREKNRSNKSP